MFGLPLNENKSKKKTAARLIRGKLFVSFCYKPKQKFNGNITIVTVKDNFVSLGPDNGLKPVSTQYCLRIMLLLNA